MQLSSHQQNSTQSPSATTLAAFSGHESCLSQDEYLTPVLENDPLLREQINYFLPVTLKSLRRTEFEYSEGSDFEEDSDIEHRNLDPNEHIRILKKELERAKKDLTKYHHFISERLDLAEDAAYVPAKVDDAYYFRAYDEYGGSS